MKLKPCPFCGITPSSVDEWKLEDGVMHYSISCIVCRTNKTIAVNTFSYLSKEEAIKIWNYRKEKTWKDSSKKMLRKNIKAYKEMYRMFKETQIFDLKHFNYGDVIKMDFGNFSFHGIVHTKNKTCLGLLVSFKNKSEQKETYERIRNLNCESTIDEAALEADLTMLVPVFRLYSFDIANGLIKITKEGSNCLK